MSKFSKGLITVVTTALVSAGLTFGVLVAVLPLVLPVVICNEKPAIRGVASSKFSYADGIWWTRAFKGLNNRELKVIINLCEKRDYGSLESCNLAYYEYGSRNIEPQ